VSHEAEYHDKLVKLLELMWGEGYMAPGGAGNVAKLLEGIISLTASIDCAIDEAYRAVGEL
jgi:hypothetical protein